MATEYTKSEEGDLVITKTETKVLTKSVADIEADKKTFVEQKADIQERIGVLSTDSAGLDEKIAECDALLAEAAKLGITDKDE